jgi:hypothetical protein
VLAILVNAFDHAASAGPKWIRYPGMGMSAAAAAGMMVALWVRCPGAVGRMFVRRDLYRRYDEYVYARVMTATLSKGADR